MIESMPVVRRSVEAPGVAAFPNTGERSGY